MAINRKDAAVRSFIEKIMRDYHTSIRARVVSVDYSIPSAAVQPIAETTFDDGDVERYPLIYDVPIQVMSANSGKARLTLPIKAGDVVGLQFSERNENNNDDQQTHGLFPGWAITSVHSDSNALQIDPDNVELWNDKVYFKLTPSGDFELQTPGGTLRCGSSGEFSFTNGAANLRAAVDGNIRMNGATIDPSGRIITAAGVDLDSFYAEYKGHTHSCPDGETSGPH